METKQLFPRRIKSLSLFLLLCSLTTFFASCKADMFAQCEENMAVGIMSTMDHPETFSILSLVRYEDADYYYYEMEYKGQLNDLFAEHLDKTHFQKIAIVRVSKKSLTEAKIYYEKETDRYTPSARQDVIDSYLAMRRGPISVKHYTDDEIAETLKVALETALAKRESDTSTEE